MNELQKVFDYQGQQVRTVVIDDEPWFVARDVCEVFGDTHYRRSVAKLDDDEKGVTQIDTPGGRQEMAIVNEPGLYNLLFTMQPRKGNVPNEEAEKRVEKLKQFKRWVTHEVLPSIRQTGQYSTQQPKSQAELSLLMAQQLVDQERKLKKLEEQTTAAHHRIDNLDAIDTIGDLQQRLNAMIRRYAQQEGLSFSRAWKDFRNSYNTAFRTNITMLIENYKFKNGVKKAYSTAVSGCYCKA